MIELMIPFLVLPVSLLSVLVVFASWERAGWLVLDLVVIPLPGPVWYLLVEADHRGRSLSNLVEVAILAAVTILLVVVRASAPRSIARIWRSVGLVGLLVALTFGMYLFFPSLPT